MEWNATERNGTEREPDSAVPVNENNVVGMGGREVAQRVVRSGDPRHGGMRINQHKHMILSNFVQYVIELAIGHR